ncbi:hypothetical protein HYH03_006402 [Edaphochlamys debaryana]|uniref:Kelch repeat-containing protein n=1 Tax=Edaphochlamys debaryana TaxID=47281 RepID=A0A835Y788_9CHLO|nr:hypothetical protein HYH03_006402 [Edaphochlamys debaryana]|eukprot:KAG2495456.1 hypothetical protein HYH03_006402 [Edaphochlamys debaryana]
MSSLPFIMGEVSSEVLQDASGNPVLVVVGRHNAGSPNTPDTDYATMILNITSNTWYRSPANRSYPADHMAGGAINNKMLVVGGFVGPGQAQAAGVLQIYDPVADTWTLGAPCPVASAAGGSAVVNGSLYYCGGVNKGGSLPPVKDCARYDMDTNNWTSIAPMPYAVHHPSMGTDGERLYVFGGRTSSGNSVLGPVDYTQIYDIASGTWSANYTRLPERRGGMGAAILHGGRLHVFGGETRCSTFRLTCPNATVGIDDEGVFTRIDRYDPATDSWDLADPGMAVPRHGIWPTLGPAPPGAPGAAGPSPVVYVCAGGDLGGRWGNVEACQYMTFDNDATTPAPAGSAEAQPNRTINAGNVSVIELLRSGDAEVPRVSIMHLHWAALAWGLLLLAQLLKQLLGS